MAFVSEHPIQEFTPVENTNILINDEACFFPYIFDNKLIGTYSHKNANGTWEMYRRTYDFDSKNQLKISPSPVTLTIGKTKDLVARFNQPNKISTIITDKGTWATSDNSVATVQKGKITAIKEGSAVITLSYGGVSAAIQVEAVPI